MENSSVDVEKVHCNDLNVGGVTNDPHFQLVFTNDEKILLKVRGKEEIEIDIEKIYNYLKENFKK